MFMWNDMDAQYTFMAAMAFASSADNTVAFVVMRSHMPKSGPVVNEAAGEERRHRIDFKASISLAIHQDPGDLVAFVTRCHTVMNVSFDLPKVLRICPTNSRGISTSLVVPCLLVKPIPA